MSETEASFDVTTTEVLFTVVGVWAVLNMDAAFTATEYVPSAFSGLVEWLVWTMIAVGALSMLVAVVFVVVAFAVVAMKIEGYLNGGRTT